MSTNRPHDNLTSGKTVGGGRYILNNRIGDQADLWLAHDEIENRPVVLHFLPAELCSDPRAVEELRSQINTVSGLSHPNLGAIYELYEAAGEDAFISLEYIEGMNLRGLQQMQPNRVFTWTFLAPLLKQILAALDFAHKNGIVQGSLKPSNLMLDRRGQIKLLNIGVAGIINNPLYSGPPQAGLGGLLPYLSPQQIDGAPPQSTDDIYSLGITIYEFLTGSVPFHTGDILPQVRNAQPQPMEHRLAQLRISNPVPPLISSTVASCLAKDPGSRPQSTEVILKSVEIAEMSPLPQAAPAPAPRQTYAPTAAPTAELVPASSQLPMRELQLAPAKKKFPIAIVAVVAVLAIGGTAAFFMLKGKKDDNVANVQPTNAPANPGNNAVVDVNEKIRQEIMALSNRNSSGSAPLNPSSSAPELPKESPEEIVARRRAREAAELYELSQKSDTGTVSIFNGKDLTGWKGDESYWSVEEDVITGRTPSTAPVDKYTSLVYQEPVGDFELRFEYKFKMLKANNQAAAAVVYRSKKKSDWDFWGYQCRLSYLADNIGMLASRDRVGMFSFTQKIEVSDGGGGQDKAKSTGDLEPPVVVGKSVKNEDWNEVVILVQGNHFIHKVNGIVVADLVDNNSKRYASTGALGLEISTGKKPAVQVQFRNLRLKKLSK